MNKRVGTWLAVGLGVVVSFAVGYQLMLIGPNSGQPATAYDSEAEAAAVLADHDRQQLARQDRTLCLEIVEEETQKALTKANGLPDKTAAAQYKQKVLEDQQAQSTRCQANYSAD
jgi:hypothetical protein